MADQPERSASALTGSRLELRESRPPDVRLRPLTDRLLARLPGSPTIWVALWALVPWLNAAANLALGGERTSVIWEQSDVLLVINYLFLSIGVVVVLWGTPRIADRLEVLRAETPRVLGITAPRVFGAINNVSFPVVASVTIAVVFGAAAFERDGWAPALLRGVSWFILGIAYWTFLWAYGTMQVALVRLGREQLLVEAPRVDPSLGVRPFGSTAFMGLWMLLVWLVPVVLTGLSDVVGAIVGLVVVAAALGLFFLSLLGLHRQMAEVKTRELLIARDLYAQAYEPVWRKPTLEAARAAAEAPRCGGRAREAREDDERVAGRRQDVRVGDRNCDQRDRGVACRVDPRPARSLGRLPGDLTLPRRRCTTQPTGGCGPPDAGQAA